MIVASYILAEPFSQRLNRPDIVPAGKDLKLTVSSNTRVIDGGLRDRLLRLRLLFQVNLRMLVYIGFHLRHISSLPAIDLRFTILEHRLNEIIY